MKLLANVPLLSTLAKQELDQGECSRGLLPEQQRLRSCRYNSHYILPVFESSEHSLVNSTHHRFLSITLDNPRELVCRPVLSSVT